MEISAVIASHNEGPALANTIESVIETIADADYEIVLADDASTAAPSGGTGTTGCLSPAALTKGRPIPKAETDSGNIDAPV